MRGAQQLLLLFGYVLGIIPAYAGSTDLLPKARLSPEDHPRVCGEHCSAGAWEASDWGSSPRMRGAHRASILSTAVIGIIPAYAGSTVFSGLCRVPD